MYENACVLSSCACTIAVLVERTVVEVIDDNTRPEPVSESNWSVPVTPRRSVVVADGNCGSSEAPVIAGHRGAIGYGLLGASKYWIWSGFRLTAMPEKGPDTSEVLM